MGTSYSPCSAQPRLRSWCVLNGQQVCGGRRVGDLGLRVHREERQITLWQATGRFHPMDVRGLPLNLNSEFFLLHVPLPRAAYRLDTCAPAPRGGSQAPSPWRPE